MKKSKSAKDIFFDKERAKYRKEIRKLNSQVIKQRIDIDKLKQDIGRKDIEIAEKFMDCKNYTHMRCECGGIVGMYDREHFTCEKCGKNYDVMNINSYDHFEINDKTGWVFPMVRKE